MLLREVEMSAVDVVIDSDENLTLTRIHNRIVLREREEEEGEGR